MKDVSRMHVWSKICDELCRVLYYGDFNLQIHTHTYKDNPQSTPHSISKVSYRSCIMVSNVTTLRACKVCNEGIVEDNSQLIFTCSTYTAIVQDMMTY